MDKIILHYFLVGGSVTRARGENVKLMLVDAGLDHEYVREKQEEWPELKAKLQKEGAYSATLPFIEIDGKKFFKSVAILRYLSTKLGNKYHGSTPEENYYLDVVTELVEAWFEKLKASFFGSEEVKQNYAQKQRPAELEMFDKYYGDNAGPYLLGEKISYTDFLVYHMIDDDGSLGNISHLPNLTKFVQAFEQRPNIKPYFESLKQ
ncbi:Glutathione S-transferase P 10 [Choanephora cucurbitarum]|uniref:Glutathione S-transferase P 10 n=1 Tax=Choanephora cucurbitarum TaxID=101091 RepID=A0A1C7NNV3_9FUNG|nr:Glutathione S-transferase P 10 [Choanephora cucurbitarum]